MAEGMFEDFFFKDKEMRLSFSKQLDSSWCWKKLSSEGGECI